MGTVPPASGDELPKVPSQVDGSNGPLREPSAEPLPERSERRVRGAFRVPGSREAWPRPRPDVPPGEATYYPRTRREFLFQDGGRLSADSRHRVLARQGSELTPHEADLLMKIIVLDVSLGRKSHFEPEYSGPLPADGRSDLFDDRHKSDPARHDQESQGMNTGGHISAQDDFAMKQDVAAHLEASLAAYPGRR